MCGLFGVVRARNADVDRATQFLLRMGLWAEDRGIDGAGLALALPDEPTPARADAARRGDVRVGRWRVIKAPGRFRDMPVRGLVEDLVRTSVVLGHTRWATQGRVGRLANTSPLVVGNLVGTHNGDIDADALRDLMGLGATVGETDTAVLLTALDLVGEDPVDLIDALSAVVGRAALAWSPLLDPRQLWLARGGLSPLAVARDEQDNLFWASNPLWLRRGAAAVGATLQRPPRTLAPGMLLHVVRTDGVPTLAGWWRYKPTVRISDVRISAAVWRGFTAEDRAVDRAQLRHRVDRPAA